MQLFELLVLRRRSLLGPVLLLIAFLLGAIACGRRVDSVRVVLITLDTLRYDSFIGAGGRPTTMPRLKAWAERASSFDRFYTSTASTQPSHASMLTGLHPWQHGVSSNGMQLAERYLTVAEALRDKGFSTSAVVASFPVSRRFGFAQGFDRFDDDFGRGGVGGEWFDAARRIEGGDEQQETRRGDPFYSLADRVVARALAELDAATAKRQFFWFHFFDPHAPYGNTTSEPTIGPPDVLRLAATGEDYTEALAQARRLYDADVSFLDGALGRLLGQLDLDASRFETHVLIVGDHGESFGEEGSMAHGRRLIPSQLHVPCLVRSPRFDVGVRQDIAGSIDVAATLLALAGVEAELPEVSASRDLTRPASRPTRVFGMRRTYEAPYPDRRLDGSVHEIEGYLFFLLDEEGVLFRGNSETLIPPTGDGSGLAPEATRRLRRLFSELEQDLARNQATGDADPEVKEKLEALGYVE